MDADTAQIVSASVVQYIRDMGISTELLTLMTEAGPSEIIDVPVSTQIRLNVVNNGKGPTVWSVESVPAGIYLKGERQTSRGMNKFILGCVPRQGILLQVLYDSERRGQEIIKTFTEHSLFINHDQIPITNILLG